MRTLKDNITPSTRIIALLSHKKHNAPVFNEG
jgi:hypothetical protein